MNLGSIIAVIILGGLLLFSLGLFFYKRCFKFIIKYFLKKQLKKAIEIMRVLDEEFPINSEITPELREKREDVMIYLTRSLGVFAHKLIDHAQFLLKNKPNHLDNKIKIDQPRGRAEKKGKKRNVLFKLFVIYPVCFLAWIEQLFIKLIRRKKNGNGSKRRTQKENGEEFKEFQEANGTNERTT